MLVESYKSFNFYYYYYFNILCTYAAFALTPTGHGQISGTLSW